MSGDDGFNPYDEPIHEWFELSYAQYLTIPRSVLQSMPVEWQHRFVQCLEELDETIDWRPTDGQYWCYLKDRDGNLLEDSLADYERGRRRVTARRIDRVAIGYANRTQKCSEDDRCPDCFECRLCSQCQCDA